MQPSQLHASSFARYPVEARRVAVTFLPVLRRIPLALLPLFLRQLIGYDWLFPPEQFDLTRQLRYLNSLSPAQFESLLQPFASIPLSSELAAIDWLNQPKHFSEQLSAYLWSVHEIDAYHRAIQAYQQRVDAEAAHDAPETARCTMVVIGAGVAKTSMGVFRRLAPHGTLFTAVDPNSAWSILGSTLQARAQQFPREHAHWYVDGGEPAPGLDGIEGVNVVSYFRLAPAIRKELSLMAEHRLHPNSGEIVNAESETYYVADLNSKEIGLDDSNSVLRQFELDVLTQGAGTQVYSTTFVQWTARECLHRAQPLTLLARFRPRQQAAPMNELLARDPFVQETDPAGALVDADMGAYYTWINQGRLPGAEKSKFLAWFEGHGTAVAIGPSMPQRAVSETPTDLGAILHWMT
jgi:hypothetical protein